jgi:3-dehydroquinate synthase
MTVTRIPVGGDQPYEAVIGAGVLGELPGLVGKKAGTVFVVYAASVSHIAHPACRALEDAGYRVLAEPVPDGEEAKQITVAAALWSRLAAARVGRADVIAGIGGGAVTDLAGFVGATWLRGIRTVLVPTTLLGMVDAAIGGKTAIDIPEGKNLVGAFHAPAGVLADLSVLETVPRADYVAGLTEIIKAGFVADPVILDLVEDDPEGATVPHGRHTRELIERAIRFKGQVVAADFREAGPRETLNYGHTLGHAIERAEQYRFRHGDAVAIGMVYAAELSRLSGRLDGKTVARHRSVLTSVGLPTAYRPHVWPDLRAGMAVDKKVRGAQLRFVILEDLGRPAVLAGPPEELLEQAYLEVCR